VGRVRASHGSRDLRRRRSLAHVTALLQQLHQPRPSAEPLSPEQLLAMREQCRLDAAATKQKSLPLPPPTAKDSPS
jgi:hypothetical protein